MLEAAFELRYKTLTLTIDDCHYAIDLVNQKQRLRQARAAMSAG